MDKQQIDHKHFISNSIALEEHEGGDQVESFQPPAFQFQIKDQAKNAESENDQEEVQLKELSVSGGPGETPNEDPNSKPFQLKAETNNTGLPGQLKSGIESMSGFSMDDVNVHYNSDKPAQLKAHAYAQGTDIHIAPGQEKHLPHEAWHVVQQKQGRVQPTTQLKAFNINDDEGLEKEADEMGVKAMGISNHSKIPIQRKFSGFSNTIQLYRIAQPNEYQVHQDQSQDARNPFTRNEDDLSITDRGVGKAPGISWKQHLDAKPALKIANDNSIAINATNDEPKEFYAKQQVITNSNQDLESKGANVKLLSAGNQINVGMGHDLVMVQPVEKNQDTLPGQNEFVSLTTDVCRDVAKHILGGITHIKLGGDNPNLSKAKTGNSTEIGGTHKLAEQLTNGNLNLNQASEALGNNSSPKVGKEYGKALRNGEIQDKAQNLGINEFAKANVGEAYTTQSIFDEQGTKNDYSKGDNNLNQFVWGYHYAAIVAESLEKADQIALENYNRNSDINNAITTLLGELKQRFAAQLNGVDLNGDEKTQIGQIMQIVEQSQEQAKTLYNNMFKELNNQSSQWYFRMIGSGQGQSFHEQMADSNFFVNPMTLGVINRPMNQMSISFNEGAHTIKDDQKPILDRMANQILNAAGRNMSPREIKIIGRGSGWKGGGIGAEKKGTKRAEAVRDYLVGKGVDTNLFTVSSEGRIETDQNELHRNRDVRFEIIG